MECAVGTCCSCPRSWREGLWPVELCFPQPSRWPSLCRIDSTMLVLGMENRGLQPGMRTCHHTSVIQTDGTQRGCLPVTVPSALSAPRTVGWLFRAHVHRSRVSEAGLRLGQIVPSAVGTGLAPQWRTHIAVSGTRRRHLAFVYQAMLAFSLLLKGKNDRKPWVLSIGLLLSRKVYSQPSRKAVFPLLKVS